jgi:phospholipid-transporting ATPase
MMNFVSISLLVSLEMVKFVQGIFIENDWMIVDESKNLKAKVQSSNLNEELGMVKYIFSDKTGTLTQNIMEFKKFSAGNFSYGKSDPKKQEYPPGITNVNFECDLFAQHWKS